MPIQHEKPIYRIPRGRAYFDPWDANEQLTGERPFGNTPEITLTGSTDKAKHYSSASGIMEQDDAWQKSRERSAKITCDNMNPRVMSLWIGGSKTAVAQTDTAVDGEVRMVSPGCIYQLGQTAANPVGVRNVTAVTVKEDLDDPDAIAYAAGVDYNVDLETGRVQILEGGGITAGKVRFGYKPVKATYVSISSAGEGDIYGALRIVSDNPKGGNDDWYFPKVSLSADGDLALINTDSDKPISMQFTADILKPTNGESLYCNQRPVALP